MVLRARLELARLSALDPKSSAAANYATSAFCSELRLYACCLGNSRQVSYRIRQIMSRRLLGLSCLNSMLSKNNLFPLCYLCVLRLVVFALKKRVLSQRVLSETHEGHRESLDFLHATQIRSLYFDRYFCLYSSHVES